MGTLTTVSDLFMDYLKVSDLNILEKMEFLMLSDSTVSCALLPHLHVPGFIFLMIGNSRKLKHQS